MSDPTGYREWWPSADLADLVDCYWTSHGRLPAGATSERHVLPDACIDLLFDLETGSVALVGTMTRPLAVRMEGSFRYLGVRFRPGAAVEVLDRPAHAATDATVPMEEVWGGDALRLRDRLSEARAGARAALLDEALRSRRARGPGRWFDPVARSAAGELAAGEGRLSVPDLAARWGCGRRQLERRFRNAVGTSPGRTARILRFQGAVRRLLHEPGRSLGSVALGAGYSDQAHFTREFASLAAETPGAYRARHRPPPAPGPARESGDRAGTAVV